MISEIRFFIRSEESWTNNHIFPFFVLDIICNYGGYDLTSIIIFGCDKSGDLLNIVKGNNAYFVMGGVVFRSRINDYNKIQFIGGLYIGEIDTSNLNNDLSQNIIKTELFLGHNTIPKELKKTIEYPNNSILMIEL